MAGTALLAVLWAGGAGAPSAQALPGPVEAGYRDENYGSAVYGRVTAEKPESKLWWNDESWWGFLWDDTLAAYRIHEFNLAAQSWTSVGPDGETRPATLLDCLWDEGSGTLYAVSHLGEGNKASELRAYSYDAFTRTYSLLPGFPVQVNNQGAEAVTIAKDTTGKLWVAWERAQTINVNRSLTSDTDWGTPFALPVQGNLVDDDDICAITSVDGGIGILWSNQLDKAAYFAMHLDGDPDTTWEPRETALSDPAPDRKMIDDHVNLAVASDGTLYAVVKTGLTNPFDPIVILLERSTSGTWTNYTVGYRYEDLTRPIVLLDEESRLVHVMSNCIDTGDGTITWKMSDLDDIDFDLGTNRVFIESSADPGINNPTSTKQNVDSITGMVVAASDAGTNNYFHNFWVPLSIPMDYGWRDASYGDDARPDPTAQKPESKLWWNDGVWWSCLWDKVQGSHRIQRFDVEEEAWLSEGPNCDTRPQSAVDCLWDGQFLYVSTHTYSKNEPSLLYSYTYDTVAQTYALRPGFPSTIADHGCEALTIAKDTSGKLWASWERGRKIWVNRSLGSDSEWGTPFAMAAQPGNTDDDDLCAIASFGDKVGVLWSDQTDMAFYFTHHVDGDPDTAWSTLEIAFQDLALGPVADDHINLAAGSDGTLYAAVKTDLHGTNDPELCVLRRDVAGTWTWHQVNTRSENGTRPIVLLDEAARRMYVLYSSPEFGHDAIHWKWSDLDGINFPPGPGDLFMRSRKYKDINNPTSTKQSVSSVTGLLVEGSNAATSHYVHAFAPLGAPTLGPNVAAGPSPCSWGTTDVGTPEVREITIRNTGLADLHVSSVVLNGPGVDSFSFVSALGSFVLVPGDSVVAQVLFSPVAPGTKVAGLQITSDDPDENPMSLILLGTATSTMTGAPEALGSELSLHLSSPRPNPARGLGGSAFRFTLPQATTVEFRLYDVAGRLIARRPEAAYDAGAHVLQWNPGPLSSGKYFVRLSTGTGKTTTTTWVRLR